MYKMFDCIFMLHIIITLITLYYTVTDRQNFKEHCNMKSRGKSHVVVVKISTL